MCDRCDTPGVLTGLLARAGVISQPIVGDTTDAPTAASADESGLSKQGPAPRRLKLWELDEKHHCPVIGTCLSLDELKRITRKGGFAGKRFDPYRLHVEAVSISCSRNPASEAMHKLLERKFSLDVGRFNRVHTDAEVLALWKWHLDRGEVAGPMWAVLTHKAASRETCNGVYADVHMLSHQVGAGQAADLRRLERLQQEHVVLQAAHAALKEADTAGQIRQQTLANDLAAARMEAQAHGESAGALRQRLHLFESGQAMVSMGRRLLLAEAQAARATALEARLKAMQQRLGQLRAEKVRLTRELDEACGERDALERLWVGAQEPVENACTGACNACDQRLHGRCVLCVGGRTPLLPQYRQLAERLGVRLIHHDGGKEEGLARLPELLNASDAVICPTDCVGHLAYYQLKKHCKQSGKPCVLAKSSGVAGFAAALTRLAEGRADIQTQT